MLFVSSPWSNEVAVQQPVLLCLESHFSRCMGQYDHMFLDIGDCWSCWGVPFPNHPKLSVWGTSFDQANLPWIWQLDTWNLEWRCSRRVGWVGAHFSQCLSEMSRRNVSRCEWRASVEILRMFIFGDSPSLKQYPGYSPPPLQLRQQSSTFWPSKNTSWSTSQQLSFLLTGQSMQIQHQAEHSTTVLQRSHDGKHLGIRSGPHQDAPNVPSWEKTFRKNTHSLWNAKAQTTNNKESCEEVHGTSASVLLLVGGLNSKIRLLVVYGMFPQH